MNDKCKITEHKTLCDLVLKFRDDLRTSDFVLLYAYNGTGKTRLSMEFQNKEKKNDKEKRDTLYFNAFTEDLFHWDNDLENDVERVLKINTDSSLFNGFKELELESKIFAHLERYVEFNFKVNYEEWHVSFSKGEKINIKISRGEENIFIWCIFLAICELVVDGNDSYKWVKYVYIDDPVSSLDDNNTISMAVDLSNLLKKKREDIKVVISSHHHLFFNVICNELKKSINRYFLHKNGQDGYTLRKTNETPFFHHVAILGELQQVVSSRNCDLKTHHFNALRSILEKTSIFFGYNDFSQCKIGRAHV